MIDDRISDVPPSGGAIPGERPSAASLVTETLQLVLLEPNSRNLGARRWRWSFLVFPVMIAALVFAVREIGRSERALAAEGAKAARVIAYEIAPGSSCRVPIEPGTDTYRIVAHALLRGPLSTKPHVAHLRVTARGEASTRTDELSVALPGTTDRVAPEDHDIVVGDPVGVNIDVHGVGVGDLDIGLTSVDAAEGLLLRVYRRDSLDPLDAVRRAGRVEGARGEHLAKRVWELDWIDTDEEEQRAILGARWRKVAVLGHSDKELVVRAIALAPPHHEEQRAHEEKPTLTDLEPSEQVALVANKHTSLRVRAEGDPDAALRAIVRFEDGRVDTHDGKGEVSLELTPKSGESVAVELSSSRAASLSVLASDPSALEPPLHAVAWRATPQLPLTVNAGEAALVLRVTARRPLPRTQAPAPSAPSAIDLDARVSDGSSLQTFKLHATRDKAAFDRYEGTSAREAPSEKAVFHLLVPPHGSVTLAPADGAIDLSISELDPSAPPRPTLAYDAAGGPPLVTKVGEMEWTAFVPRRPSNVAAFAGEARRVIRISPHFVPIPSTVPRAPAARVVRPKVLDTLRVNGRVFDPSTVSLLVESTGDPIYIPIHVYAPEPIQLLVRIDGEVPARRRTGAPQVLSTSRTIAVHNEVRAMLVLGDDVPRGPHVITFLAPPWKKAWVHAPWAQSKANAAEKSPGVVRWIEGDLQE